MQRFLRRNLISCYEDTKANTYFTMVRSNLECCPSVWNPYPKDQVNKVEMVQRRTARFTLTRYRNTSTVSSMFEHLQWESLESRRCKIQLTFFHKVDQDLVDIPAAEYLTPSTARSRSAHIEKSGSFLLRPTALPQDSTFVEFSSSYYSWGPFFSIFEGGGVHPLILSKFM